jgi:alanyl-tRNA synthetase
MGDGPCGPCTEIFYDFQTSDDLPNKITDLESKRFLEIGNIVFSEYYHQGYGAYQNPVKPLTKGSFNKSSRATLQDEKYLPLEQKCVDFGGGLERIGMAIQGKKILLKLIYGNRLSIC